MLLAPTIHFSHVYPASYSRKSFFVFQQLPQTWVIAACKQFFDLLREWHEGTASLLVWSDPMGSTAGSDFSLEDDKRSKFWSGKTHQ